jgi:hypothetical protein
LREVGVVSPAKATPQLEQAEQCFGSGELDARIATLRTYLAGPELEKAGSVLLRKARESQKCRAQVIEALITAMSHITLEDPPFSTVGVNEQTYYLWQNGSDLLAKLQATEALDLLIANIGLTDGLSISLSHYPALAAITRIGSPAIPKLQVVLRNDSVPYRRKFAAFCIAYIGGHQARSALTNALPGETDPCVKNFLQLSLQAFDNRAEPNHISSEQNGKWLSAFYCL